jgi:peroxiredoxin
VKLNDLKDQFDALDVGIAGMTYDKPEIIQAFDKKWDINFPVLKDVERNMSKPGAFATKNTVPAHLLTAYPTLALYYFHQTEKSSLSGRKRATDHVQTGQTCSRKFAQLSATARPLLNLGLESI